jgi:soluble lytic murein transglycosylase-like protein
VAPKTYANKIVIVVALAGGTAPYMAAQNSQMESAARQMEQTQSAMAASIKKQMANFRKPGKTDGGATSGGFFVTESSLGAPLDGAVTADCEPLSPLQIESLVTKAAAVEQVSADLIRAVIHQESGGRPCAVSPAGAMGLMQLMPGTAGDLGVPDSLEPEANVMGGAKFLKKLLDRYSGDLNRALGAYNAGPEPVDEFQGVPPFPETVNYVDSIMHALQNPPPSH